MAAGAAVAITGFMSLPANAATLAGSSAQVVQVKLGGDNFLVTPRTSSLDSKAGVSYSGVENPVPEVAPGLLTHGLLTQTADSYTNHNGGHGSQAFAEIADVRLNLATIDGSQAVNVPPINDVLNNVLAFLDLSDLTGPELENLLGTTLIDLGLGLDQVVDQVEALVNGLGGEVTPLLTDTLNELDTNVILEVGAVRAEADASHDGTKVVASGDAVVDGARIIARIGGRDITLVTLPSVSDPNTVVTYNLSSVVDTLRTEVLDDVVNDLDVILQGELTGPYRNLITAVRDNIIAQLDQALQPLFDALNDTVVTVTINKQEVLDDGVEVIGLQAEVLPGASNFGINNLAEVNLARVSATAVAGEVEDPQDPPVTPENPDGDPDPDPDGPDTPDDDRPDTPSDRPTPRDPDLPVTVESGV